MSTVVRTSEQGYFKIQQVVHCISSEIQQSVKSIKSVENLSIYQLANSKIMFAKLKELLKQYPENDMLCYKLLESKNILQNNGILLLLNSNNIRSNQDLIDKIYGVLNEA